MLEAAHAFSCRLNWLQRHPPPVIGQGSMTCPILSLSLSSLGVEGG
jgi:hypothetical protein